MERFVYLKRRAIKDLYKLISMGAAVVVCFALYIEKSVYINIYKRVIKENLLLF